MKNLRKGIILAGIMMSVHFSFGQVSNDIAQKATMETEMLTQKLTLTPEQNEKVSSIVYGILSKNEGIKNSDYKQEEKNKIYADNAKAKDAMLKEVLSENQYNEYLKLKK